MSPPPSIFLSALGTTKGKAGSFEAQYAIDHDLNVALAKAAKERGTNVYVLISSAGASTASRIPYMRMKGEIEEDVKNIGFKYTVILRPGFLVGVREDSRLAESILGGMARAMGMVSKQWLTDWWAQDAHVVANAAIAAGLQCLEGKHGEGVWLLDQSDIIRLGRTEWKGV
jgi:uncharacterized protein YbjT (DUF2867 family)